MQNVRRDLDAIVGNNQAWEGGLPSLREAQERRSGEGKNRSKAKGRREKAPVIGHKKRKANRVQVLRDVRGVAIHHFRSSDVVRHPLVGRIVEAYDAYEKN